MNLSQLIKETFSLGDEEGIKDEFGPGDLPGWDSVGHVELINAIEEVYAISITNDELVLIENIGDIKKLLQDKSITNF